MRCPEPTAGDQAVNSVATNDQTGAVTGSSDSRPQGLSPTANIALAVVLSASKEYMTKLLRTRSY
jgi:hypothetical protein